MQGYDRARSTHLGFAEHERKNGDIKINPCDSEDPQCPVPRVFLHGMKDFRGMVLLALWVEGEFRIHALGQNTAGHTKNVGERRANI